MQNMKNETCKIAMSYEITDFRNIVIKSFFRNNESENVTDMKNEKISENSENTFEKISQFQNEKKAFQNSPEISIKRDRDRFRKLSLRYKNSETDISIFLQNSQNDSLMQNMQISTSTSISAPIPTPFVESRKKK